MLRVYDLSLAVCRRVAPLGRQLARVDADLARQLRRAVASVPLNIAEGVGSRGGNRRARYATAMGSALEVRACLDVAEAMGYLEGVESSLLDELDRLGRTLNKLSRG